MKEQRYIRKNRCQHCREPHWFLYWVGRFCASASSGLAVGNFDMTFHRFKLVADALGQRDIEHIMVVEVKTADERLGIAQRDTLSVFNGALNTMIPVDGEPIGVEARPGFIRPGDKKIVWHGAHLLRVPFAECNTGPFYWDNELIGHTPLVRVLNFVNDPNEPGATLDIERRHKRGTLFQEMPA